MGKFSIAISILVISVLYVIGVVYWFQAEKEVDFFCGYVHAGDELVKAEHFLETVVLTEFEKSTNSITAKSRYGGNATCRIDFSGNQITGVSFSQIIDFGKVFALLGLIPIIGMMIFQCLLAMGKPYGEYAWGGFNKKLPTSLRVGSAVSVLIFALAGIVIMHGGGFLYWVSPAITQYAMVALMLLFAFSTVGNSITKSDREKKVMLPVSVMLVVCFFTVLASMW